jgi:hypothetical protein
MEPHLNVYFSSDKFSLHVPFTSYGIPVGLNLCHAANPLQDVLESESVQKGRETKLRA